MDDRSTSHGPPQPASSVDSDYFGGRDREVDLGQLFSDVSKTVGKFRNILSNGQPSPAAASSSSIFDSEMAGERADPDSGSPLARLFGSGSGVCFKTCGMEDIQFAARRAGEMFITMKVCMIVLTLVAVLCVLAVTCALLFYMYKNRHALQSLTGQRNRSSDESTVSVTPLIFNKRTMPPLNQNVPKPPPPVHQQASPPQTHQHGTQHSPSSGSD